MIFPSKIRGHDFHLRFPRIVFSINLFLQQTKMERSWVYCINGSEISRPASSRTEIGIFELIDSSRMLLYSRMCHCCVSCIDVGFCMPLLSP